VQTLVLWKVLKQPIGFLIAYCHAQFASIYWRKLSESENIYEAEPETPSSNEPKTEKTGMYETSSSTKPDQKGDNNNGEDEQNEDFKPEIPNEDGPDSTGSRELLTSEKNMIFLFFSKLKKEIK